MMEPQNTNNASRYGFISADGYFQQIGTLTVAGLEYVSKSRRELELLLQENVQTENYEACAIIRDEILKRKAS
jgi:protein-arginine kinase activator protein McsA